ncbi:MAG: IS30 family transposase [Candidatus Thiodiazotropha sp. (ex Lucinoma aequizonata)]|nr:IS30 family transposase [Candidatus Thiodiazotropha sp. (ex Lucinoma aequizonata)]MCU7889959.1 IS30 family transposase [Candidatus Thiodiazotropha sp. (ex Lucinoma aequizonata)]MCU7893624.1 IS30 family transposase [Candidatus Thiodiazotropha sp. (ex Lucinoma aequizonata)]MCU7898564.1 IS30 family transposase [Candidatus Thiodiazotropha sp. (ex Lucinoma aequizonata)]MCU7903379.1 IS30 family transposase [Candidatus Thiodiazotropha sp. (ex Lucinoma aequizonata)]
MRRCMDWFYEDKAAGGDLYKHLRVASKPYRKRYGHYDRRGKIKNCVDIDERPAIVESRRRIGDWEGDTVMGKGLKSALLTMVERKTLYTVIMRLTGKQSGLLAEAAVVGLKALKSNILTITLDNGQVCLRSRERFWDIPVHQNRLDL